MLECEGYKMFHGSFLIHPLNKEPFRLTGVWLFKPDTRFWYCKPDNGGWTESWDPDILTDCKPD